MAASEVHSTLVTVPQGRPPLGPEPAWYRPAELAFLLLLFAAACLVRLWPIWQVHFWDEAVYLQNAEVICCGKDNYSELSSRPPLLSLLFAAVFLVWRHQYAASLLVAALNALGPLFLYGAGKMLSGRAAGGIAALLLAFSPFLVKTGNSLLSDSPALTLTLVAFFVLLKAVSTGAKTTLGLAGFLSALAGLMRFTSLITLVVFPLYLLRAERRWRALGFFALGLVLGFGPYLVWSRLRYGWFFATLWTARLNVGGSVEPARYYLQHFGEIFPWLSLAGAVLWFAAWLLDTRIQWERQDGQLLLRLGRRQTAPPLAPGAILWWWAFVALAYFSTLPHKELRYLIPFAAPWFLLAGRGLGVLLRGRHLSARAVGAGLLVLALAYSFAPVRERLRSPFIEPYISEEKRVADYLNGKATRPDPLYVNFNAPVFAYYTRLPVRLLLEEDRSFFQVFPKNMPQDGYLMLYKELYKEPKPAWADRNPHFQRLREFPSLVLYQYRTAAANPSSPAGAPPL